MDIKTILVKNNKNTFEKELIKHINDGYKIITSNLSTDNRKQYSSIGDMRPHNAEPDIYFYALLQKDK